jgi:hypothetical protein
LAGSNIKKKTIKISQNLPGALSDSLPGTPQNLRRRGSSSSNIDSSTLNLLPSSQPDSQAKADGILMSKLRVQIETLTNQLRISEEERLKLDNAVRRREQELTASVQQKSWEGKGHIMSRSVQHGDSTTLDSKLEMLVMADSANNRIIDQLNGQVDFLNDQLALREAQLSDIGEKLLNAQELKIECENRSLRM